MNNYEEYDDDDCDDPGLFAYVTGEELLAELKAAEAKRAAPHGRRAMTLSRTSILMLTASVFAALSAVSFAG